MKLKIILSIFVMLFLMQLVNATVTCQLDKTNYLPGETALFTCGCTNPGEQNRAGDIIWRNSSNFTIKSTSTTSGSCITSIFGDNLNFDASFTFNFTGNTTFESVSVPPVGNLLSDNFTFNATGQTATSCVINSFINSTSRNLGEVSAFQFRVIDGITMEPLVNSNCVLDFYDVSRAPLNREPYDTSVLARGLLSSTSGEVIFLKDFDEAFWRANTTYRLEAHCSCLNTTDNFCVLESTGQVTGPKFCRENVLWTTQEDNRDNLTIPRAIMITIAILALFLIAILCLTYSTIFFKFKPVFVFLLSLGILIIVILVGYLLFIMNNFTGPLTDWISTYSTFFVLFAILSGVGLLAVVLWLVFSSLTLFSKIRGTREEDI